MNIYWLINNGNHASLREDLIELAREYGHSVAAYGNIDNLHKSVLKEEAGNTCVFIETTDSGIEGLESKVLQTKICNQAFVYLVDPRGAGEVYPSGCTFTDFLDSLDNDEDMPEGYHNAWFEQILHFRSLACETVVKEPPARKTVLCMQSGMRGYSSPGSWTTRRLLLLT